VRVQEGEKTMNNRCCSNCLNAVRLASRWFRVFLAHAPGLMACISHPDSPGQIIGVSCAGVCSNFRPRHERPVRSSPLDPPDAGVRYIPLTQGKYAIVDAEDYERVSRYKWCLSRSGNQLYAQRRSHGKTIRMHQFIMNPPKGMVVDHIDGNGLNNRRSNLRICTRRQNGWNLRRRKRPGAPSQYVGVYPYKDRPGKWYVKVQCRGEVTNLGPFDSDIEAARARDRKARELFGEFARLNFPEDRPPGAAVP
jgi:hypothetical protein